MDSNFRVKPVELSDLPMLTHFFKKAYGEQTPFQSTKFLQYYFAAGDQLSGLNNCVIAVSPSNEVASLYGGFSYNFKIDSLLLKITWGVNAYTLPGFRGLGLNSQILNLVRMRNQVNAVIGMPAHAPEFYCKLGYNNFNRARLHRQIYTFDDRVFSIASSLGPSGIEVKNLININSKNISSLNTDRIVELNKDTWSQYIWKLEAPVKASTFRDGIFLKWRVFENPHIKYKVFAYTHGKEVSAYIALREETLFSPNCKVCRIVDLFGNPEGVKTLVEACIRYASSKDYIYIDYSAFGTLYTDIFQQCNFDRLDNDDYALLPQVTSPVESRPNHEFVVMESVQYSALVKSLTETDIYLTRIDADRDRISQIEQIKVVEG